MAGGNLTPLRLRLALVAGFAVGIVVLRIALRGGRPAPPALLPGTKPARPGRPLAWSPGRSGDFARRAVAGLSHVLYAKSPGGLVASAERTATWRPLVDQVAKATREDPDTLEAIVLLES